MSTALGDDASSAYHRFDHQARTLGTISRSFDELTRSLSGAYFAALARPAPATWTVLVAQALALVSRMHAVDGIVVLDPNERAALDFFEAIVRENADLLPVRLSISAVDADRELLVRVSA